MPIRNTAFSGDCNDLTETGWYKVSNYESLQHCPGGNGSYILHLKHPTNYHMQYCFARGSSGNKLYARECSAGTWTDWEATPFGLPSFYKNYANLNALSLALNAPYRKILGQYTTNATKITINESYSAVIVKGFEVADYTDTFEFYIARQYNDVFSAGGTKGRSVNIKKDSANSVYIYGQSGRKIEVLIFFTNEATIVDSTTVPDGTTDVTW